MSASSALITDISTVITNGPNAATLAKASNPAGPIQGYTSNTGLVKLKLQETAALLATVVQDTDSSDSTNLTLLNGVVAALNGTSSPSTAVIADLGTVYSNGPNAASKAKATNPNGPIQSLLGNVSLAQLKLQEAKVLLTTIQAVTDSSDSSNLTLIGNLLTTLV